MRIAIIGMGYVGATTAAVLASWGHKVLISDKNVEKCERFLARKPDIYEPGLVELIVDYHSSLELLTDTKDILQCDIVFVCVNTPYKRDGLDLVNVFSVLEELRSIDGINDANLQIAIRSTVSPDFIGLLDRFDSSFRKKVLLNPEFLREGCAINDFNFPPKIVIGTDNQSTSHLRHLYNHLDCKTFEIPMEAATLTKLIDNSWHALKVAFGNEIGGVIKSFGLDVEKTLAPFFSDTKLNMSRHYLTPGNAFGGSCLTKDLDGLAALAELRSTPNKLLKGVRVSNDIYIEHIAKQIMLVADQWNTTAVVVHGISFKSNTNDLRESPNIKIGSILRENGLSVTYTDSNLTLDMLPKDQINIAENLDKYFSRSFKDISDFNKKLELLVSTKNDKDWFGKLDAKMVFEI